jgi:hypothetical protein
VAFAAEEAKPAVTLVIDYGDGVQKHFHGLAWTDGATVWDVLEAARRHPRGIQVEIRGKNATAFLVQIDDCRNQGRGKNWVYRINGKLADKSFAVQPVREGETITWEFGEYRQP